MKTTTEKRQNFERLIAAAEREIQQNPRLYNIKVACLALLGYAVIFSMLLILIAIVGGIGWAALASSTFLIMLIKTKLIFVLLVTIYVLLRALWVKFGKPTGFTLKAKDYPQFFSELRQLTKQLKASKIHQVIITPEHNAAIVQIPRLGIFGWYKNTLFLGLELLLVMSPEQARAVIAHELGHLSGKHSQFSGWIYRVRLSWHRIVSALQQQSNFGANIMRRFFDWYSPTFAAYSFALARANEYAADAVAAQLTSAPEVAKALVNSHVTSQLIVEHYWQPFVKQAEQIPQPHSSPYSQLQTFLQQQAFDETAVAAQLQKALAINTSYYDTHPALKDRLAAIQAAALPPQAVTKSAAQYWLSQHLHKIIAHFDQQWLQNNQTNWQERYQYFQEGRAKLAELQAIPQDELNAEQLWELAVNLEKFIGEAACLPLFNLYKSKYPDEVKADFVIGRLLLVNDDVSGVDYLQRAMDKQQNLKVDACEWLIYYYHKIADNQAAEYWQLQLEKQIDINQAAKLERQIITLRDDYIAPDTATGICDHIAEQIRNMKVIKHAWLAEKKMQHYPEVKTYVLVFSKTWWKSEKYMVEQIIAILKVEGVCFVVMKGGRQKAIAKRVMRVGVSLF